MTTPADDARSPERDWPAIARRRAIALDVTAIALALGAVALLLITLAHALGWPTTLLITLALVLLGVAVLIMRRPEPLPPWLTPRAMRTQAPADTSSRAGAGEAAGTSYGRARTVDEGAPRSPLTGR